MGPKVLKLVVAMATVTMPILAWASPAQAANSAGPSDVVTWVNNLRGSVGAAPLATDATLTSVAQQWANHMATTTVLAHNPNLATQMPTGWSKMGENIGTGYSLLAVYNALVASPDHYTNMVDPAFNRTGVGVATDAKGLFWVTEDLGNWPPPTPATMVFPGNGDVIFPSPETFTWGQATGAQYYCITVGTTQGNVDLLNSGLLQANQLSYPVPALPGGQPLWARIYTYAQGTWIWSDVKFSVTGPNAAQFTQPTAGATNVNTTQPFTWTPLASAGYYAVTVGTTFGGYDLANSGLLPGSQSSYTAPALPAGQTLWARVYSWINGSWAHWDDVS
ncbi:MAG: CAP domain-containing protein, partial [Actinomycetota bacterium]|nr:CAP domain-containing protein [Actinomycetota bacterium]